MAQLVAWIIGADRISEMFECEPQGVWRIFG
jgi:hypothetical protein